MVEKTNKIKFKHLPWRDLRPVVAMSILLKGYHKNDVTHTHPVVGEPLCFDTN